MKHTTNLDVNTLNHLTQMFCGLDTFINQQMPQHTIQTYPPYNLYKIDETNYVYEISVVGFNREDIEVKTEKNKLLVSAKKQEKDEVKKDYIIRNLAQRNFNLEAGLAPHTVIKSANIKNGILYIVASVVLPDELKPRVVQID